jgi:hypothetical protein
MYWLGYGLDDRGIKESRFDFLQGLRLSVLGTLRSGSAAHSAFYLLEVGGEGAATWTHPLESTAGVKKIGNKPSFTHFFIVLPFWEHNFQEYIRGGNRSMVKLSLGVSECTCGVELSLHSFVIWAMNKVECLLYSSVALPSGKEPQYSLNRRLGRPQRVSGLIGEEKQLVPLPGIEPWFLFLSALMVVTVHTVLCGPILLWDS